MPEISKDIIEIAEEVNFSKNLRKVLSMAASSYHIDCKLIEVPYLDPLHMHHSILLTFRSKASISFSKPFKIDIRVPYNDDEAKKVFDAVADEISHQLYLDGDVDLTNTLVANTLNISNTLNTIQNPDLSPRRTLRDVYMETESSKLIKEIANEISSRGDFEIDIPKFVDILFKLSVIKAKGNE